MLKDAATRGPILRQHEESCHDRRVPAALLGHLARQSDLPIQRREHPAQVRNDRFHFDHEERPSGAMESENVHRSTLAVVVERDLGRYLPVETAEDAYEHIDERGMASVAEAIESLALKQDSQQQIPA